MSGSSTSSGANRAGSVAVREVAVRRMWVGLVLTIIMFVLYSLYLLLYAYAKASLAWQLTPGVTAAMIVGLLSIVIPCVLAGIYMRWANRHLDTACDEIGQGGGK